MRAFIQIALVLLVGMLPSSSYADDEMPTKIDPGLFTSRPTTDLYKVLQKQPEQSKELNAKLEEYAEKVRDLEAAKKELESQSKEAGCRLNLIAGICVDVEIEAETAAGAYTFKKASDFNKYRNRLMAVQVTEKEVKQLMQERLYHITTNERFFTKYSKKVTRAIKSPFAGLVAGVVMIFSGGVATTNIEKKPFMETLRDLAEKEKTEIKPKAPESAN